jgi:hypothetical protein
MSEIKVDCPYCDLKNLSENEFWHHWPNKHGSVLAVMKVLFQKNF